MCCSHGDSVSCFVYTAAEHNIDNFVLFTCTLYVEWSVFEYSIVNPEDLDLHCLPLSMWIYSNNLDRYLIGWKLKVGMAS